jgi:hypothetical protein
MDENFSGAGEDVSSSELILMRNVTTTLKFATIKETEA